MTTRIELEAVAQALASWGEPEVWGIARDDTHEALAHGVVRDGVLVFDDTVVLERTSKTERPPKGPFRALGR